MPVQRTEFPEGAQRRLSQEACPSRECRVRAGLRTGRPTDTHSALLLRNGSDGEHPLAGPSQRTKAFAQAVANPLMAPRKLQGGRCGRCVAPSHAHVSGSKCSSSFSRSAHHHQIRRHGARAQICCRRSVRFSKSPRAKRERPTTKPCCALSTNLPSQRMAVRTLLL